MDNEFSQSLLGNSFPVLDEDNQMSKYNEKIEKFYKVIVPFKYGNLMIGVTVFASIITLGLINISSRLRQNIEHHALIIQTENGYYITQFGDEINPKLEYKGSMKDCIDPILKKYNRKKYSFKEMNIPKGATSILKIRSSIISLKEKYNSNNYDFFNNNCQHYLKDLLKLLKQ